MIHRPDLDIRVIGGGDGIHLFMNIELKVLTDIDFFQMYPLKNVITLRDCERYEECFYELFQLWVQDHSFRDVQSLFLVFTLLNELLGSVRSTPGMVPLDLLNGKDRFRKIISYMQEHLHEKINRNTLADLVFMDPVYFSRDFQRIYGNTPVAMLKKLRLRRAKMLLENSSLSIKLIADQCGFYDQAHFTRSFQHSFQLLPSEYKESIRQMRC
ncbi:helix-turn-helix domain-containing protein [Paenibacillus sp. CMAA1364]